VLLYSLKKKEKEMKTQKGKKAGKTKCVNSPTLRTVFLLFPHW
jgi:hypothetical protein